MPVMTVQLVALAFNAAAPERLASFWAHALRWTTRLTVGSAVELVPTDGTSFHLLLQPVAHEKVGQNRIHFDLTTTSLADQEHMVAALLARGATHVDIGQDPADTHVVLADPEDNELCIIEPHNRFLAGCPRLGAVNCDGTHALGCFWSAALGWPFVWDEGEETAIQAPDGTGPKVTWSGPPLMPRIGDERIHFHVAPAPGTSAPAQLERLRSLGATSLGAERACPGATALADVDGNRFCFVEP